MNAKRFNYLLKKLKNNDKAFTELYNYYFPKIIIHFYIKYKNKQLSEDIAQDFFAKLLSINIDCKIEKPTPWVYTVCDNIAKNIFIKYSGECFVDNDILQAIPDNRNFEDEIFGEYTEKLKLLEEDKRKIIIKHLFEGYSLKEIAEEENISYVAIRQKYSRSLKKLK